MFYFIPILLLFYVGLSLFSYVPAIPNMASEFDISIEAVTKTIAIFMLTYGLFKSIWLVFASRVSDKVMLIISMLLSIFGIGVAMLATNATIFFSGRIVEAIGISGTLMIARSRVHKGFDLEIYSKFIANAAMYIFLACFIGPFIGYYLYDNLNWRYIFGFLLVLNLFTNSLVSIAYIGTKTEYVSTNPIKTTAKNFFSLFANSSYMKYLVPCSITLAGCYSYFAISSHILKNYLSYSALNLLLINGLVVGCFILGGLVETFLKQRLNHQLRIKLTYLPFLAALTFFFIFSSDLNFSTLTLLLPICLFTFASGILCPLALSLAKEASGDLKVEGAAMQPFMIFMFSGIACFIVTALNLYAPSSLNFFYCGIIATAAAFYFFSKKPSRKMK